MSKIVVLCKSQRHAAQFYRLTWLADGTTYRAVVTELVGVQQNVGLPIQTALTVQHALRLQTSVVAVMIPASYATHKAEAQDAVLGFSALLGRPNNAKSICTCLSHVIGKCSASESLAVAPCGELGSCTSCHACVDMSSVGSQTAQSADH